MFPKFRTYRTYRKQYTLIDTTVYIVQHLIEFLFILVQNHLMETGYSKRFKSHPKPCGFSGRLITVYTVQSMEK
jgi:hypothetical protein